MRRALKLTRTDFCNLENSRDAALSQAVIGIYADEDGATAYSKVEKVLSELEPVKISIGWDLEVYPKFSVVEIEVH